MIEDKWIGKEVTFIDYDGYFSVLGEEIHKIGIVIDFQDYATEDYIAIVKCDDGLYDVFTKHLVVLNR